MTAKNKKKQKLTDKQRMFIKEYLIDLNATQACIRAGYSKKTANRIGTENLSKPVIQEYLTEEFKKRSVRTELTQDEIIEDLREVKNRCMQKVPVMFYNKETKEYEQEVDDEGNGIWRFEAHGANRALELLGKHKQMFSDKIVIDKRDLKDLSEDELDALIAKKNTSEQ